MKYTPYCYKKSKLCDDKDDFLIDKVEVGEEDIEEKEYKDVELVKPLNQYMVPFALEF